MGDYYELLEIKEGAEKKEIRRAFCRLAKKHHPDVSEGNGDFIRMVDAYRTLIDDKKRKEYNKRLRGASGSLLLPKDRIFYAVSLKDIALSPAVGVKNGGRCSSRRRNIGRMMKGYDVRVRLSCSELLRGAFVRIDVPAHVICPLCGGNRKSCSLCADRGHVTRAVPVTVEIPCGLKDGEVFRVSLREKKRKGYAYFVTDSLFVMVDLADR